MTSEKYDCLAKVATPADVDAIVKFYRDHPSNNVVIRKPREYERSVNNELFTMIENDSGQMVGGVGIYELNNGKPFPFEQAGSRAVWGSVGEIGSVELWREGLPENARHHNIWRPFLFSVPVAVFSQRVGIRPADKGRKAELPTHYLATSIFKTNEQYAPFLKGETQPSVSINQTEFILSPVHMREFKRAEGYNKAFLATANDPKADREKLYFMVTVADLPRVAEYMNQCARTGLVNAKGEILKIDMSDLTARWTIGSTPFDDRLFTGMDTIVANRADNAKFSPLMGWGDWGRSVRDGLVIPSNSADEHLVPPPPSEKDLEELRRKLWPSQFPAPKRAPS